MYKRQAIPLNKGENVRTLRLLWNNGSDMFVYKTTLKPCHKAFTKRTVLSVIADIYDPLGLLGPVVFLYKRFMQQLWETKTNWDEVLSDFSSPQMEGIVY